MTRFFIFSIATALPGWHIFDGLTKWSGIRALYPGLLIGDKNKLFHGTRSAAGIFHTLFFQDNSIHCLFKTKVSTHKMPGGIRCPPCGREGMQQKPYLTGLLLHPALLVCAKLQAKLLAMLIQTGGTWPDVRVRVTANFHRITRHTYSSGLHYHISCLCLGVFNSLGNVQ